MVVDQQTALATLGVVFGGGIGVSVVGQGIKKLFGLKSATVIHTLIVVLAGLAAGAQYVTQLHGLPASILGISATAIYGFSQVIYRYATYGSSFLSNVQAYNAAQKAPGTPTVAQPAPTISPAAETPTAAASEPSSAPSQPATPPPADF